MFILDLFTLQGKKVDGNDAGAVDVKKKKREYRQYLFVKGAYDVPLTRDQLEEHQAQAKEKESRKMKP